MLRIHCCEDEQEGKAESRPFAASEPSNPGNSPSATSSTRNVNSNASTSSSQHPHRFCDQFHRHETYLKYHLPSA